MPQVWSFNTTVRNPDRVKSFLRTLKELEGVTFDEIGQEKFFGLQIKKRLYTPTPRTLVDDDLIKAVQNDTGNDLEDSIVNRIVTKREDAPLRGRTTAGILNKIGLSIALKSHGPVEITELGHHWLNEEMGDQELYLRFFLKWQYPNPLETGYEEFEVKPFIATLKLIKRVNELCLENNLKPVGLSHLEFRLFVPSLVKYSQVEEYSQAILQHRLDINGKSQEYITKASDKLKEKRLLEIFDNNPTSKSYSNLKDYADSAIRYFRMSGFVSLRGNGRFIDNSPEYKVEIDSLLKSGLQNIKNFENSEEYLLYLADISEPELPWINEQDLKDKKELLISEINSIKPTYVEENEERIAGIKTKTIKSQVEDFENILNKLKIQKLKEYKYNVEILAEAIAGIDNSFLAYSGKASPLTPKPSLDLEWFTSISIMVLNDARDIIPNYKVGDDGLPTGFKSNVGDLECIYDNFGLLVEVTLLMGRDQWYAEGQPVQRHLREFEEKYDLDSYCLFIAPYIHTDTLNTYWNANKHGYMGETQKIIPLTLKQFMTLLSYAEEAIKTGKQPKNVNYQDLLDQFIGSIHSYNNPMEWTDTFNSVITSWGEKLK